MTPTQVRANVVSERVHWIRTMIRAIRDLPLASFDEFSADARNAASAESFLRRGTEALLDLGRHILAKGFGEVVAEHKQIGAELTEQGVLSKDRGMLLRQIAGYRNRMVHFYHEVSREELYQLSTQNLEDLESILAELVEWLRTHPDKVDQRL